MTDFVYEASVALDPSQANGVLVRSATGAIYAITDTSLTTPLTVRGAAGDSKTAILSSAQGVIESFIVANQPEVIWASGPYAIVLSSVTGIKASAAAAAEAASDAATSASQTEDVARVLAGAVGHPILAEDNGIPVRIIAFSDGTVRAIPTSAIAPAAPTGVALVATVSRVTVTWNSAAGASGYDVYRNGTRIAQGITATRFVDWDVIPGTAYAYTVRSRSQYSQLSALSTSVSVMVDADLNADPTVVITAWPAIARPGQKQVIRVAASDVDAQALAYALQTTSGTLEPTLDPSVWLLSS